METKYLDLTIIIRPDDGQFAALCEELGTATCADSVEEARMAILEAIELHLEGLTEVGELERFLTERGVPIRTGVDRLTLPVGPLYPNAYTTTAALPIAI